MERYDKGFPYKETVFDSHLISGETTLRSEALRISGDRNIGVWFQAISSSSVPKLKLYYEVSHDDVDSHFAKPEATSDLMYNLSGETVKATSFTAPPLPYIKFVVQGMPGNPNDTVITEVVICE